MLRRFRYDSLPRSDKRLVRQYLEKVSAYSRAQLFRLIALYRKDAQLRRQPYQRHRFPQKYTRSDSEVLARTDELHDYLSGPATKKIPEREYGEYGHEEYSNICLVSVAHLYNLRRLNVR